MTLIAAISIHAPRTGSDGLRKSQRRDIINFNPRSPHGERHSRTGTSTTTTNISIHAPRTGSDWCLRRVRDTVGISIHAPRTGSDRIGRFAKSWRRISIHAPRTGSDWYFAAICGTMRISIHAPRTGSDWATSSGCLPSTDFNPRSPHGERRLRTNGIARTL